MQVTGFGYEHDALWKQNMQFFKEFTDTSQGVRRLGAAAIDLCHVALGEFVSFLQTPMQVSTGKASEELGLHHQLAVTFYQTCNI